MSKEYERFKKRLPQRERFFLRCASLAFGRIRATARLNWLRAICESDENLRASILLDFVRILAKEMAGVEYHLLPQRGTRPMIEETALIEADSIELGLSLPKAMMKTGAARNIQTARKKAAAIRSRKYRAKKRNVTQ